MTDMVDFVIDMGDLAAIYKWKHDKSSNFYTKIGRYLTGTNIFIGALTGTGLLASIALINEENSLVIWIQIIGALLVYFTNIISAFHNFLAPDLRAERHHHASNNYSRVYHRVKRLIASNKLEDIDNFSDTISREMDYLYLLGPPISERIQQIFNKKFTENNLKDEDIIRPIMKNEDLESGLNINKENDNIEEETGEEIEMVHKMTEKKLSVDDLGSIAKYNVDRYIKYGMHQYMTYN